MCGTICQREIIAVDRAGNKVFRAPKPARSSAFYLKSLKRLIEAVSPLYTVRLYRLHATLILAQTQTTAGGRKLLTRIGSRDHKNFGEGEGKAGTSFLVDYPCHADNGR